MKITVTAQEALGIEVELENGHTTTVKDLFFDFYHWGRTDGVDQMQGKPLWDLDHLGATPRPEGGWRTGGVPLAALRQGFDAEMRSI